MCNKHYTTSVKTRFTFVFYTDSYIRGINHIFYSFILNDSPLQCFVFWFVMYACASTQTLGFFLGTLNKHD